MRGLGSSDLRLFGGMLLPLGAVSITDLDLQTKAPSFSLLIS